VVRCADALAGWVLRRRPCGCWPCPVVPRGAGQGLAPFGLAL
jgi:hypothetical protein